MKIFLMTASVAVFWLVSLRSFVQPQAKEPGSESTQAQFIDSSGKSVGNAILSEDSRTGVKVRFDLRGLPPGVHGIHIHETGTCAKPDFKSAGKHFNPASKEHGVENPKGFHAGDLGNIEVAADGTATKEVFAPEVTLKPGERSLIRPGGTSIVIHAGKDDQRTDPSGNSGNPIACGVIESVPFSHSAIHTSK